MVGKFAARDPRGVRSWPAGDLQRHRRHGGESPQRARWSALPRGERGKLDGQAGGCAAHARFVGATAHRYSPAARSRGGCSTASGSVQGINRSADGERTDAHPAGIRRGCRIRMKWLHRPSIHDNTPLAAAFRACVTGVLYAGVLSLVISLLQLIVPIYMLQVYDRIINSRSVDTLIMLTVMAMAGLVCLGVIDYIRARVWFVIGGRIARRLDVGSMQAAITGWVRTQSAESRQAPRDLNELRLFLSGGA